MNIDELKNIGREDADRPDADGVINNPNLVLRKQKQAQIARQRSGESTVKKMDPKAAGFKDTPKSTPEPNDIDKAFQGLDAMIQRKQEETRRANELIEENDGEISRGDLARLDGVSEDVIKELGWDDDKIKVDVDDDYDENLDEINAVRMEANDPLVYIPKATDDYDESTFTANDYLDNDEEEVDDDEDYKTSIEDAIPLADNDYDADEDDEEESTPDVEYPVNDDTEDDEENLVSADDLLFRDGTKESLSSEDDDSLKDDDEEIEEEERSDIEPSIEEDPQVKALKEEVKKKIRPVKKAFNLTGFKIKNKPISVTNTLTNVETPSRKIFDWVLMASERPISMRGFTGDELDRLNDLDGKSTPQAVRDQYNLIYSHIMDKDKPITLEKWAKSTSFLDIPHIWFAIYRSCFEGSNFIPYDCPNDKCKNVFLSDNIPINNMVKFKNDEAKAKFYSIYNSTPTPDHQLYTSEIVPISDDYAVSFREPSIYSMLFEPNMINEELIQKYSGLIRLILYIDEIFYIDYEYQQLVPINNKVYENNEVKTVNTRYKNFIKVLRTLDSDQLASMLVHIKDINDRSNNDVVYVTPEVTCDKCGERIPETKHDPSELVFTRHKLAALAAL